MTVTAQRTTRPAGPKAAALTAAVQDGVSELSLNAPACAVSFYDDTLAGQNLRAELALKASWEIESLLNRVIPKCSEKSGKLWKRGALIRVRELSWAIMEALGGNDTAGNIHRTIHGQIAVREEARSEAAGK